MKGKMSDSKIKGRGWHGNSKAHAAAGAKGGAKTASTRSREFYQEIGRKGGVSAHKSGNAYKLTAEDRSRGGKRSKRAY